VAVEFDEAVRKPLLAYVPGWIHPNHLTILRALLLWPLYLAKANPIAALGIIVLSSLCDLLDGPLARLRGITSQFGAVLDATSDKVFILGTLFFVCPEQVHEPTRWIILSLDALLTVARPIKTRFGVKTDANKWGACKVWAQTFGIGFVLSGDPSLLIWSRLTFLIAIFFGFCSIGGHVTDVIRKFGSASCPIGGKATGTIQ
jgi:phosphatidylglycerophosphate synthase